MHKKNQVSPEISSPGNGWQEEDTPHSSANQDSWQEDAGNAVKRVRPKARRFKCYPRQWSAMEAPVNRFNSRTGASSPSTQVDLLEEHSDTTDDGEAGDHTQALLRYFLQISNSDTDVDLTYIEHLLSNGADIHSTDEYSGTTVMHEVAENWDVTVAQFLYDRGIDSNRADNTGKTPLHIAAGVNHRDMIVWLIRQGADVEAKTNVEKQTPVHHAARSDSVLALEALIQNGGNYETKDYKGRTPLYLAAELDRTLVANFLISLDIPAKCTVTDNAGSHVITCMIRTMPKVAAQSLDQLHKLAPADRKQYFILSNLEHRLGDDHAAKGIKSPFEVAVEEGRYEILTHSVMEELIKQKWKYCVRWYYYTYLGLYFIFLISWSVLISFPSVQLKHCYVFPTDIWRIVLEIIALGTYIHQVAEEIAEVIRSNLKHKRYTLFRQRTLQDDLDNTDISLPEEKKYLLSELESIKKNRSNYFKDPWNIIDIITYVALLIVILLHIADIAVHTTELAVWTARFSCVAVLLIWVRLLNLVRALRALGPLVAIISELIADILRYFAIYVVFFVPYMISVWVLFGGDQSVAVAGNEDLTVLYRVIVVMFRMSLIDSFPYETMRDIDELMTVILVITFLIIMGVVGLNLFIALLSDTFQRVYDNAQANALLQQAKIILLLEDKVSSCTYQKYLVRVQNSCNPYSCFYDDDDNSEERPAQLQKIAHQIHNIVTELQNNRKETESCGGLHTLKDKLDQTDSKLSELSLQMKEIKAILCTLTQPVRSHPFLTTTMDPNTNGANLEGHQLTTPAKLPTKKTIPPFPHRIQVQPRKLTLPQSLNRDSLHNESYGDPVPTTMSSLSSASDVGEH